MAFVCRWAFNRFDWHAKRPIERPTGTDEGGASDDQRFRVQVLQQLGLISARWWLQRRPGSPQPSTQPTAVAMSNNNASNNLIIAQRAVKQLRLEASIRRIKVRNPQHKHGRLRSPLNGGDELLPKWHRPDSLQVTRRETRLKPGYHRLLPRRYGGEFASVVVVGFLFFLWEASPL